MNQLPDFQLEVYFSRWEFAARHVLTASDAQSMSLDELLALGTEADRAEFGRLGLGYAPTWGGDGLRQAVADWEREGRPSRGSRMEITVPSLTRVVIDGAGDVNVRDISGKEFAVEINGAGDMKLDGEVDSFRLGINGAGDVDARKLIAREVSVILYSAMPSSTNAMSVWSFESTHLSISEKSSGFAFCSAGR